MTARRLVLVALALAPVAASAQSRAAGGDWPQLLGPSRDGRSPETGVFPATGPVRLREAWRRALGPGGAGLSIAGDRLVTLDSDDKGAFAVALSTRDGSPLWRTALDAEQLDAEQGPGSTPAVADGLAFVVSPACQLRALELEKGAVAWHVDLKAQFGAKPPRGCVSSPLIDGARLVVQTGAPEDKRIAALDRRTGQVVWTAKGGGRANASSPGLRGAGDAREILLHQLDLSQGEPRSVLGALRAEDGQPAWQYASERAFSFAVPVPAGDRDVLLLTWNDALLVRPAAGSASPVWRNTAFTAYVAAPVYRDGHLYGHGGDYLRCVRASDGTTAWEQRTYPGSVVLVDGQLVVLSVAAGLLRVVEATPEAYRERARLLVAEPGSHVEIPPSVAGRRIFVRNEEGVVAVDVER